MSLPVRSPVIMGPLIKDQNDPVWKCWLAHVAEVRFSVRRAFVRGVDGRTMRNLHETFLEKFAAVPQWQDAGFEKPKFHPSEHLEEQLEEFGPFRAYWCFPWEAYLQVKPPPAPAPAPPGSVSARGQSLTPRWAPMRAALLETHRLWPERTVVGRPPPQLHLPPHSSPTPTVMRLTRAAPRLQILKRMFEMCNWLSAPTTVATNWATKSVMHYRNPSRGSWFTDDVEASSEFSSDLASLAEGSPLLRELLLAEAPCAVRSLRSVTRDGDAVQVGDWVVVRRLGEPARAGRVREMLECASSGEAFSSIRLRCEHCKDVHDDETTGAVWAAAGESNAAMIVSFEKVHIEVVVRSVTRVRDEFM